MKTLGWVVVLLAAGSAEAAESKAKLIVQGLTAGGGLDAQVAEALTENVTQEVQRRGLFQALSTQEVKTILGQERQRQLLGCTEGSCMAELADALGARFVLSGSLTKLGPAYQLNLQTVDTVKATPIGRATRIAGDLAQLRSLLPYVVAEATATPLPPPPSHLVPYGLIAVGAAAVAGGGLVGFNALSTEGAINRELNNPAALQPLSTYRSLRTQVVQQKDWSLGLMAAGVAIAGVGFWLNPSDVGAKVALLPTANGGALAGTW